MKPILSFAFLVLVSVPGIAQEKYLGRISLENLKSTRAGVQSFMTIHADPISEDRVNVWVDKGHFEVEGANIHAVVQTLCDPQSFQAIPSPKGGYYVVCFTKK